MSRGCIGFNAMRFRLLLLLVGLSGCNTLRTPCEQTCYAQKTHEPRDFDDCIQRCRR